MVIGRGSGRLGLAGAVISEWAIPNDTLMALTLISYCALLAVYVIT